MTIPDKSNVLTASRIDEIIVERLGLDADEYAMAEFARAIEAEVLSEASARIAALEADARRYQWLRTTTNSFTNDAGERINVRLNPEAWDAAIDQAMAEKGGKT